ncbi:MAG TPA: isoleucine--tRNA ligase [Verrucomicrobiae bacterium]
MDYKDTLNLPRTDFAMKADLVTREPERLKKWEAAKLYEKIQASRVGAEKFVLHDGPPFANGDVHVGTALNKILKDIIVKYQTLRGKSAPYIPGWDCHGLPIEFKVSQEMRKGSAGVPPASADVSSASFDPAAIRKACDAYARKFIDIQRTQFKRLGVLGDWENPYLTLNKEYEAEELCLFADIVANGFVYRGKKPVYWCIDCRTALAEAEVEYAEHVSQSVFVKFPVIGQTKTFIIIWTTTPWTLPANLAVAFNPKFQYSQYKVGDEKFIVCDRRLNDIAAQCGLTEFTNEKSLSAEELAHIEYHHPFCARTGRLFPAAFVDDSTGTGFVHIAPGHGLDDYNLGHANGLPIYSPVNDEGALTNTNELPVEQQMPAELLGKSIREKHGKKSDANEAVLALLHEKNVLLHPENYPHSYPFCWRSKTPVIFRAMDQWFIKVDHRQDEWKKRFNEWVNQPGLLTTLSKDLGFDHEKEGGLRSRAMISASDKSEVRWIPDWGSNRIYGALASRPDWCISRQRTWGVPIPAFYDANGTAILDAEIVRAAAKLIGQHGSNIWFEKSASELWSLVKPKDWKGAEAVSKSNDTLDVWIDSGSSSRAVLKQRKELQHTQFDEKDPRRWQADVYLEGSDQHRGWFQSSLLLSLAGNGAAPFKTVLTHGFMVDADREKISKSKQGAYEKPQTAEAYVKKYGADVLRLWVASQDYRSDIVVSEERINKVGETYRAIRNALRYQLSNLYDFDPNSPSHKIEDKDLTGLDRWILGEFAKLEAEVLAAYDQYEFHVVYQKLSQFIAVELSSVYHDVIKDRLYTDAANSPRRRSTQTALHRLVTGLCQMLAPILAFTADEAWEFVPGKNVNSVHESNWIQRNFILRDGEQISWRVLLELRELALPELEKARQAKNIGKSLDAKVILTGASAALITSKTDVDSLRELTNVSQLEIKGEAGVSDKVSVTKADGQKCERCWHYETDIGQNTEHPTICGRCVEAVRIVV